MRGKLRTVLLCEEMSGCYAYCASGFGIQLTSLYNSATDIQKYRYIYHEW